MEYERRNGMICVGNFRESNGDRLGLEKREREFWDGDGDDNRAKNTTIDSSLKVFPVSSSNSSAPSPSSSSPLRYIEHPVTKFDTLAGIAIRYGVEVADIKKMNGLVTDLQMFARKTLYIPLPGRHPPSPCLSNGHSTSGQNSSEQTPPGRMRSDILESFQSLRVTPEHKVSPAMSSLQGYYGLNDRRNSEGCEMSVYRNTTTSYREDEAFTTPSPLMNPLLSHEKRSRSVANGFKTEEGEPANDIETDADKWINKLNWRRQKSEADFNRTPEKLLKEENATGGWFSAITGKSLALRTKVASRTNLASEAEVAGVNGFSSTLGDSGVAESSSGVRKSSSTSSLQEQDGNGGSSSIWSASKWSLKPDLQAALSRPIFDGLPKPITGRRAKAALD